MPLEPPHKKVEKYEERTPDNDGEVRMTAIEARDQVLRDIGVMVTPGTGDGILDIVSGGDDKGAERLKLAKIPIEKGDEERTHLLPPEGTLWAVEGFQGLIPPLYRMDALVRVWDTSSILPQAIDAMARNIDGYGFKFRDVIDFTSPDIDDTIRQIIIEEENEARKKDRAADQEADPDDDEPAKQEAQEPEETDPEDITDDAVDAKKKELKLAADKELQSLKNFFGGVSRGKSFTKLRVQTRKDLEITGNAYWEVVRNLGGEIVAIRRGEAETFRITTPGDWVDIKRRQRVGILQFHEEPDEERFRRYAQLDRRGLKTTWYKAYGDPRILNKKTGQFQNEVDGEPVKGEEVPLDDQANEVIHFSEFSKGTPYGRPRWIGVLLAVLGIRQSEEMNMDYFENKAIPPFLILVSGGKVGEDATKRLKRHIEEQIKGSRNFHRGMVLEATRQGESDELDEGKGTMRIHFEPLTPFLNSDAQFQEYEKNNREKVESVFRLPPIFLGRSVDYNRATSIVSKEIAEDQVFMPERLEFDDEIDRLIMVDALAAKYWKFESLGIPVRNEWDVIEMAIKLTENHLVQPFEVRPMVERILRKNLEEMPVFMSKVPADIQVTLARNAGPDILALYGVTAKDLEDVEGFPGLDDGELPETQPGDEDEAGQDGKAGDGKTHRKPKRQTSKLRGMRAFGILNVNGKVFEFPRSSDDPMDAEAKREKIVRELRVHERRCEAVTGPALDRSPSAKDGASILDRAPDL